MARRMIFAVASVMALAIGVALSAGDVPPTADKPKAKASESKSLDKRLLEDLSDGEETAAGNPVERIGRDMRDVQKRLADRKPDPATQAVQERVVADLDKLLKQIQSQQQKQQSGSSGQKSSSANQTGDKSKSQPNAGDGDGKSKKDARDSTDRQGTAEARRPTAVEMRTLLEAAWGHLPDRVRQSMLQNAGERFLRKYELEIEEYFKRLAEEEREP